MEHIDINDTLSIMKFGTEMQLNFSGLSECAFAFLKKSDLEKVGEMLGEMIAYFKDETKRNRQEKELICREVDRMREELDGHYIRMLMDCEALNNFRKLNKQYAEEIGEAIAHGKGQLALIQKENRPDSRNRFMALEKRIKELELTLAVSGSFDTQMSMVCQNESQMAERIQSTLVNALTMWKSRMVIEERTDRIIDEKNKDLINSINELLALQKQGMETRENSFSQQAK